MVSRDLENKVLVHILQEGSGIGDVEGGARKGVADDLIEEGEGRGKGGEGERERRKGYASNGRW